MIFNFAKNLNTQEYAEIASKGQYGILSNFASPAFIGGAVHNVEEGGQEFGGVLQGGSTHECQFPGFDAGIGFEPIVIDSAGQIRSIPFCAVRSSGQGLGD